MKITLGSTSLHKLNALRQACEALELKAEIDCVKTSSGQKEQPVGFEETFAGALNRAVSARRQRPDTIVIGIESGIFCIKTGFLDVYLDIAIIVVLDRNGRRIVTTSSGMEFPVRYIKEATNLGFKTTTIGSVITKELGGDPGDPHSTLTGGKISRTRTLVDALVMALKQI